MSRLRTGASPTPAVPDPQARVVSRAWLLLLLLAAALAWMPMVAYPSSGRWLLVVASLLMLTSAMLRVRTGDTTRAAWMPGVWALALGLFAWARWAAGGFPFAGTDGLTTLLFAILAGFTAHGLLRSADRAGGRPCMDSMLRSLLTALATGGFLCGLHAMAQRLFIYDRMRADLLAEIGAGQPTPLQLGLLHHFALKRVASVWGDPNALGAFLAVSTLAGLMLAVMAVRRRSHAPAGLVGAMAVPSCLVGIWFSGSRGALLDLVIGVLLATAAWLARRGGVPRAPRSSHAVLLALAVLVVGMLSVSAPGRGDVAPPGSTNAPAAPVSGGAPAASGWRAMLSRSDTLRERGYYALVGFRIFRTSPLLGAGPGAVDQLYGRLKPPEARESKYLHNWVFQIAAEYGMVGLLLAGGLLLGLGRALLTALRRGGAEQAACAVAFVMLVCDGLYQLSFNQRELMMLAGILGGSVLAVSPRLAGGTFPRVTAARAQGAAAIALFAVTLHAGLPALHSLWARQRAEAELDNGRPAAAIGVLRRARMLAPRDPQSWALEAHIVAGRDGPAAALPLMERAVSLNPASASLHSSLADLLSAAGRQEDALAEMRRAVGLYPTKADYRAQLSRLLEQRGDLEGALREARLALDHAYLYAERHRERLDALEAKVSTTTGTQESQP